MTIDDRLAAAGLPLLQRRVWLEIDQDALSHNLKLIRQPLASGVTLNAVVKADAYGHGLIPAARVFENAGADRVCVASFDEAMSLRSGGLRKAILVLFSVPAADVAEAVSNGIEIVASERSSISETLATWRRKAGTFPATAELNVHLEIETGLSRGGIEPQYAVEAAQAIASAPKTRLASVWSHLATPEDPEATQRQVDAFGRATSALAEAGIRVPERHLAATGGILGHPAIAYEGVRPGLALYGIAPAGFPVVGHRAFLEATSLRPAMELKCMPLRVETFPRGTAVGYGGTWVARRKSVIATLPVGYGDGFVRAYSPGAEALVRGHRVPLVGTVAMDAVMADVTDVPAVDLADEFVLLGSQGDESITANDLARLRNTIPWEVVTGMSFRLPRVYHAGSVLMGLRTLAGEFTVTGDA